MVLGCTSVFVMHLWIVFSIWGQCWNFFYWIFSKSNYLFFEVFLIPHFWWGRVEGDHGRSWYIIIYTDCTCSFLSYNHICTYMYVYISWHQTFSSRLTNLNHPGNSGRFPYHSMTPRGRSGRWFIKKSAYITWVGGLTRGHAKQLNSSSHAG